SQRIYAKTGKDGTYDTRLAAGRYHVSVDGGYSVERDITGPGTVDINLDLERIVVTVVDATTEAPIEAAKVYGHAGTPAQVIADDTTSSSGQVKLDVPHALSDIVVEKAGY